MIDSKKNPFNFDLMYIELTDVQKKLEESTDHCNTQHTKMQKIFNKLRKILKHKTYDITTKGKTMDL